MQPPTDQPVDLASIECRLSELWHAERGRADTMTRAALWNVIAHTDADEGRVFASETLARVSAAVPQRTIVIRARPGDAPGLSSSIGVNCHSGGGEKRICSEEISLLAGGGHVQRLPPLVHALLIPDMPAAAWWVGDLPNEDEQYVLSLLDPVDRLVVDSVDFDSIEDLALVSRLATKTHTLPADLNWNRLEEWRMATAAVFDPPMMRRRLETIRSLRIAYSGSADLSFGERVESLLYAAWLAARGGYSIGPEGSGTREARRMKIGIEGRESRGDARSIRGVELRFEDGSAVTIERNRDALEVRSSGMSPAMETITPLKARTASELMTRELSLGDRDSQFLQVLPIAMQIAELVNE